MYTEAIANYRAGERIDHAARVLCEMGKVALAQGEISQAQTLLDQALRTKLPTHIFYWENREPSMLTLEAIASLAIAQGQMENATRLLGATETWHARFYYSRTPRERQEREACISALHLAMGEQTFAIIFAEGQIMTQEQAVEYALKGLGKLFLA